MRSGELASAAGVNVQTLRYYERRGLLPEPRRSPGGHRDYDSAAVRLLGLVRAAQRLGFTLDEIAALLGAHSRRQPSSGLRGRAREKLREIDGRMAELATVRDALARVVDAECDSLTHCAEADCPLSAGELAGP
ncbi:MerR family transcriptional regulator [Saccharomonospora piscinae]|uniref:MerR family transcriptional regulator n=1 Tax=Saccharomonospora piscinae TaxID=687388 RepID=UPI001105C879|nr:MerR family transcriptional regulator [Saccharomonospora piscinae]TLW94713.1 MerR family transcriptional regulator [Saccharomonospora piscinae]